MYISEDIKYIGVNDHELDLFEGQYIVPNGMAYNSYLIIDEKIAVLDTVDKNFKEEWLNNIKKITNGRSVDYLIVHHMEPDHSANIMSFFEEYPSAKIVSSMKAFSMMKNFFKEDFINRRVIVNENDSLSLGATLKETSLSVSFNNLSSIFLAVTILPSLPTNGEVFTPNVICNVGSSILKGSKASSFPTSQTVSPTLISGSPAIAIKSPALASSTSIRFNPK